MGRDAPVNNDDYDLVGEVLSALEYARESLALLPPPPQTTKPVYLRILNAFYRIRDNGGCSRVSDINKAMGCQLPNTTKAINEMAELNIVEKFALESDKRVVLIKTTELGEEYIQKYIVGFHKDFEKELTRFNKTDLLKMIDTVRDVSQTIQKIKSDQRFLYTDGSI